ncbi:hypothetical protein CVT26_005691 [Gymnopilus dilepis]|uniref:Uncharacterized protein n=1 Tax=Gymnopilus dilepis TaxID=231916 RepID=A0A409W7Z8_9AGAR|nr:hypothetical protein CVT26_005691 [Gymnopilus dilepis]
MSSSRQNQNATNGHPIHPINTNGFVGNALESDVPITRPIAISLVICGLILLLFFGFFSKAILAKKGTIKLKAPPALDLEEASIKDSDQNRHLQSAFLKSCFDTYPRRFGSSSPRLGFSNNVLDTPTSTSVFRLSYLSSLADNITIPPPAYSSRTHTLVSRNSPSISFLDQIPPSLTRPKRMRRSFPAVTKEKQAFPLVPPPPIISSPISLPDSPLPGPPIEHEYSPKPSIYLIPELSPMSPIQISAASYTAGDTPQVSLIAPLDSRRMSEHITANVSSVCSCACHESPSQSSVPDRRRPRPRPIYIPARSLVSLSCQEFSDCSSLASSQIGLAL